MDYNEALTEIAKKYNLETIGLFGSRARKDNRIDSDYDIFIIGNLTLYQELEIEEILENELKADIDLIKLDENMNKILLKNILNDAIIVYDSNNAFNKIYKFTEKFFIENSDFIALRERDLLD